MREQMDHKLLPSGKADSSKIGCKPALPTLKAQLRMNILFSVHGQDHQPGDGQDHQPGDGQGQELYSLQCGVIDPGNLVPR